MRGKEKGRKTVEDQGGDERQTDLRKIDKGRRMETKRRDERWKFQE